MLSHYHGDDVDPEAWEHVERSSSAGRVRVPPCRDSPRRVLDIALPDVMGSLLEFWPSDVSGGDQPANCCA